MLGARNIEGIEVATAVKSVTLVRRTYHSRFSLTYYNRVKSTVQRDICGCQMVANNICAGYKVGVQGLRKSSIIAKPRSWASHTHLYTYRLHDVSLCDFFDPFGHFSFVFGSAKFWLCTQDQIFQRRSQFRYGQI
jgi:hypothetical protein